MQIYIIVLSFQNNYQPVFYSNTQQFSYPYYLPRAMQYVKKNQCLTIQHTIMQMHSYCIANASLLLFLPSKK